MSTEESITATKAEDALLTSACCLALATLVPVSLYQTGLIRNLPDPPASVFDSEQIVSSKAAHPFGFPDGILGLASFGTTLALIVLAKRKPAAKTLLGVKLALDGTAASFNAVRQVIGFRKLCSWCTGTAIAAGVMTYAGRKVISEAWSAAGEFEGTQ